MSATLTAFQRLSIDGDLFLARSSLVAILTLFILFSGLLLPSYLRGLQQEELNRIKVVFHSIGDTQAFKQADSSAPEFHLLEYLAPVLFTAAIVFVFSTISLFGGDLGPLPDYVLGGTQLWNLHTETPSGSSYLASYEQGTLSMIVFAFFGSFIWSVQYVLGRITTRDINPGEFYKISINMIFAIILAVAIRHSLAAVFYARLPALRDTVESALPTVGFLIGLFPNFFLEWLVKQVRAKWFGKENRADGLDLVQIEGLSDSVKFRLRDLDIDNAQHLAFANPVSLYMRTRFGLTEAIDWVAQAQLLIAFKFSKSELLRGHAVRTICDLVSYVRESVSGSTCLAALASELGMSVDDLRALIEYAESEPSYVRLRELRTALCEGGQSAVPAVFAAPAMAPS